MVHAKPREWSNSDRVTNTDGWSWELDQHGSTAIFIHHANERGPAQWPISIKRRDILLQGKWLDWPYYWESPNLVRCMHRLQKESYQWFRRWQCSRLLLREMPEKLWNLQTNVQFQHARVRPQWVRVPVDARWIPGWRNYRNDSLRVVEPRWLWPWRSQRHQLARHHDEFKDHRVAWKVPKQDDDFPSQVQDWRLHVEPGRGRDAFQILLDQDHAHRRQGAERVPHRPAAEIRPDALRSKKRKEWL